MLEVIYYATSDCVDEVVTRGAYVGLVDGQCNILIGVPEFIPHVTWHTTVGDTVLVIASDLTTSGTAVTNVPPDIIAIEVGGDCVSGRDYGFSSVGRVKNSYGEYRSVRIN